MKQTIRLSLLVVAFAFFVPLFSPQAASAALPVGEGGDGTSENCTKQTGVDVGTSADGDCAAKTAFTFGVCGNTDVSISCMVGELMKFLTVLVGIAVVGGITVGGITYSTGAGNAAKTQKGVNIILNSILGLVLFLLMFAVINFLIPGGILK